MNAIQKQKIISLRKKQIPYATIAESVGLSVGTIKSFCHRNNITMDTKVDTAGCKNCGQPIEEASKTRPRLFCCEACKVAWWNKHRGERKSAKMIPHTCPTCGKVFAAYSGTKRKFCSQDCYRERSEADGQ